MPYIFNTISLFLFCFFWKRNKQKELRAFIIYIFFVAISSWLLALGRHEFKIINLEELFFLLRISVFCELSILMYFLYSNFQSSTVRNIILFLWIVFLPYCIYDWYINDKNIYSPYPLILADLLIFTFSLLLLLEKTRIDVGVALHITKIFWFAIAMMLISTGLFFMLSFNKTTVNNEDFRNQYRIVFFILVVSKNILISIGLLIKEKAVVKLVDDTYI